MKNFLVGVVLLATLTSVNAQAQYAPVPSHGPQWLVGQTEALPEIWATTPSVSTPENIYLDPTVCRHLYWRDWGGRTCAHGIAVMLGDITARARLCGKPDDHTPALERLAGSAAYSFGGTSSFDVANTIDAYSSQYQKIRSYLLDNPTLRLDCPAVAKQTKRIVDFVANYLPNNLQRFQNLPPVLQDQQLPHDGGNGQPTLWAQQAQTLFRQTVPQEALDDWKEMKELVTEAAVQHLSAALKSSRTPLRYDQRSLQTQYEYINQSEGLTRAPRRITVQLAAADNHIAIVSGQSWTELLVPLQGGRQGGLNVVVQMIWQGGGDACLVQVNGFGVIGCDDFMTDAGMPAFLDTVQKANSR